MRRPSPPALVSLAAAAACAALRVVPIYDPDCFWHLHTGRVIAATHAVPTVDTFSHTARGRPWLFVDWLGQLLLWGLYRLDGYAAVILTTALLGSLAVFLAMRDATESLALDTPRRHPLALLAVAPLLVAGVMFRDTPRPQTFTFALLAALPLLLRRPRAAWAAPALIALWQNTHSSAPLGVAVVGAWAVGAFVDRRLSTRAPAVAPSHLAAITVLSALALLIAVRPIDRLTAGLGHVVDPSLAAMITEWSPTLHFGMGSPAAQVLIAMTLLALVGATQRDAEKRPSTGALLVAAGVTVMAFRAVRFVPLAALALTPVAGAGALRLMGRRRWGPALAVALALAGVAPVVSLAKPAGFGVMPGMFPVGAARFIARTQPRGRMFNDFLYGGYLMFTLEGRWPVFVDGRSWSVYDPAFMRDALTANARTLARILPRYDIGLAVVQTDSRVVWFRDRPGWSLVYFDDDAFVAVRDDVNAGYVTRWAYREVHPARWADQIGGWSRDPAARARAMAETRRMVTEAPGSSLAWVLRAAALTAAGEDGAADAAARRAATIDPLSIPTHRALMVRAMVRGDRAGVCREAGIVLRRAPRNVSAMAARDRYGCER